MQKKEKMSKEINKTIYVQNKQVPASHVAHSCDPSTLEAATTGLWVCGQAEIHSQTLSQKTSKDQNYSLKLAMQ